jgi:formylglycine-generating enzyme
MRWIAALLVGCSIDATIARVPVVVQDTGVATDASTRCPQKAGTATMIDLGDFCIDATETTRRQYAAFLSSGPTNVLPSVCAGNSFVLGGDLMIDTTCSPDEKDLTKNPDHPVVCVDWCDAAAYCAWAGKRLCGAIGGGSQPFDDLATLNDVKKSEWYAACAGGQSTPRVYTYGDTWNPGACVDKTIDATADVGSKPLCHGPPGTAQAAVYDMTGNVYEWVDSCQAGAGDARMANCLSRGGFFRYDDASLKLPWSSCAISPPETKNTKQRGDADDHIGIRCCAR